MVGTLHYLAPERLHGRAADERSDIYAFGVILYEMLAGARPFDEPTEARFMSAILTRDPAPPTVNPPLPSELGPIVMTMLCKEPDDRWQSAGDVAKILRGIAARLGSPATPAPESEIRSRTTGRYCSPCYPSLPWPSSSHSHGGGRHRLHLDYRSVFSSDRP